MRDRINWRMAWSNACWYGFCPTPELWGTERRRVLRVTRVDMGDYPDHTGAVTNYRTPDARHLVTLHERCDTDPVLLLGSIAHESYHVAMRILEGMAEDEPGEETVAYTMQDVAQCVFEDFLRSSRGARFKEANR